MAVAPHREVRLSLLSLAVLLLALAGCGLETDERYAGSLLPLVPGATWDYRTSDERGAPGARTLRVAGSEDGLLVLETRENGGVRRSFLEGAQLILAVREEVETPDGARTVEYFDPGALRALGTARLRRGQRFEHRWQQRGPEGESVEVEAAWVVEAVGVQVTVHAGVFEDAVRIRRTQSDGSDALLWYAPGVGLLRATGAEQLELIHWALP